MRLLNSFAQGQQPLEEVLLRHYEDLFDLVQQFGMGMVVFPALVAQLQGSYSIQSLDQVEPAAEEAKVDYGDEQDQAQPLPSKGKLRIFFKLPFDQYDMNKKTMSPYTPLNKTKEIRGSMLQHDCHMMLTYKSPNIDMSKRREEAMTHMKQKMQQNSRSPMVDSKPQPLNMFKRDVKGDGGRAHSSDPREVGQNQNQMNMFKAQV